jgi:hypothetical protein
MRTNAIAPIPLFGALGRASSNVAVHSAAPQPQSLPDKLQGLM